MRRGDVFEVDLPGSGRRPCVVLTRQTALPVLANVTVAAVTTRVRELPTEVPLDREHGVDRPSVINCDTLFTVPKRSLLRRRGALGPLELRRLDDALRIALELD